jgi:hypothetical protein
VREVRVNGRELAENALDTDDARNHAGIELVAARDFASIGGTVVSPDTPPGGLLVVAVPAAAERIAQTWPRRNIWTAAPSADGRFLLQARPPGDYQVFALRQPEDGPAPLDTESLAPLRAMAMRVTLPDARQLRVELRPLTP